MPDSEKLRRPGYTPANTSLGRRGIHTRDRIMACAAELFLACGYHGTSMDAIAKAVGGSRAAIYQYFESKEQIFAELARQCGQAVLEHGQHLGRLGPDAEGLHNLGHWLREWAELYDTYAMVFGGFPGIGTIEGLPATDTALVADTYTRLVTGKLRAAGVTGIDPAHAAAALLRISHMVNLYRYRGMFGLSSRTATSESLAIAMQLMLFPDTPARVIAAAGPRQLAGRIASHPPRLTGTVAAEESAAHDVSPTREDLLAAASALLAEHGYYSVAMADIAVAANVSRATLYRLFSNKLTILAELTRVAVIQVEHLAVGLVQAATIPDIAALQDWMSHYVRFHRSYRGVIRAWFEATLAEHLSDVSQGVGALRTAVAAILDRFTLPAGVDPTVAAAIVIAVLGRMTEPITAHQPADSDDDTAALMVQLLQRALLRQRTTLSQRTSAGADAHRK